jgi:hypothetical protein
MSSDALRRLLLIGASPAQLASLDVSLAGVTCKVLKAWDYHGIGAALADGRIDMLVYCGTPPGMSAKRLLPSLVDRANPTELVVAMPDQAESAGLAEIFGGRAAAFPPPADIFQACASRLAAPREMRVRTHSRWRLYSPAELHVAGRAHPALILNVSSGGAMLLSNVPVEAGALVAVMTEHDGVGYSLAGNVRHMYLNMPVPPEALESMPLLRASDPAMFGIEFIAHSRPQAEKLCAALAESPLSIAFGVLCIPGVPRGLTPVFETHGVSVQVASSLAAEGAGIPDVVIADIATCGLDELPLLKRLAKKTVLIGIATQPIADAARSELAALLPAVFVLPFQTDTLIEAVERFFRPIHRRFPRLDTPFTAVVQSADGRNLAADGVNLSLSGIAVDLDAPLTPGASVRGTLSAENAHEAVGFEGKVVYCRLEGRRHRAGIHMEIDKKALKGYVGFLSNLMHRDMQVRWRRQVTGGAD